MGLQLLYFFLFVSACSADILPSYFPRCYIDDPEKEISVCLTHTMNDLKPHFIRGITELNIPPISPFLMSYAHIDDKTRLFNYSADATNIVVEGLETYNCSNIGFNKEQMKFYGTCSVDYLKIAFDTVFEGVFMANTFKGNGKVVMTLGPASIIALTRGRLDTFNGYQYYNPLNVKIKFEISDFDEEFDGLINDDKEFTDTVMRMYKDNKQIVRNMAQPYVEKQASIAVRPYMKKQSQYIPFFEFFITRAEE